MSTSSLIYYNNVHIFTKLLVALIHKAIRDMYRLNAFQKSYHLHHQALAICNHVH